MFIFAKRKGAQHVIQEQCFSVRTDLKVETILPRSRDEEYLISHALKHLFTEKSELNKQQIRPALVNSALEKLANL